MLYFYGKSHEIAKNSPLPAQLASSFTKLGEHMHHMTLNKHGNLYAHRAIAGVSTVIKVKNAKKKSYAK